MPGVQAHISDPVDLSLHAVRLLGFADAGAIARRFGQDSEEVKDHLLDFEAFGWVTRSEFAGSGGWSLTEAPDDVRTGGAWPLSSTPRVPDLSWSTSTRGSYP